MCAIKKIARLRNCVSIAICRIAMERKSKLEVEQRLDLHISTIAISMQQRSHLVQN